MSPNNPYESPVRYMRCGAKRRNGEPCKGAAMCNGRCRIHGGKTPSGPGLPQFKTGKHSKLMKDLGLSARFEELLTNPQLGELREDIALIDVHLDAIVPRALGPKSTADQRQELRAAIDQRRKLVDSLHKNAKAVVPVERVYAFMHVMTNLTLEVVKDPTARMQFLTRLRGLIGQEPSDMPTKTLDPRMNGGEP